MIEFHQVCSQDISDLTLVIPDGGFCGILAGGESTAGHLVRLLSGLERPDSGTIRLLGHDLSAITGEVLINVRLSVGVVHAGGGLISNLKARENVTLPLAFHRLVPDTDLRMLAGDALNRAGFISNPDALPGNLQLHDRRLVALARVLLLRPKVVIYESTFDGLQGGERERLVRLAEQFHRELEGRSSLLIASSPASFEGLPIDTIYRAGN